MENNIMVQKNKNEKEEKRSHSLAEEVKNKYFIFILRLTAYK